MSLLHRRNLLLEILSAKTVASQQELVAALASRGVEVGQATVSRDLAAIGAVRSSDGYGLPGTTTVPPAGAENSDVVLRRHATSAMQADSLVVIKTAPGHAAIVGDALDAARIEDVVGTIAGENTVFVATVSRTSASRLAKRFATLITGEDGP